MVLACAEGLDNQAVAKKLRCSLGMVGKWRSRFLESRLEGLYDEPRPGAPRKVGDEKIEAVVIQTLESTPRGQTHWSTRELAKASGLSRMTISRIWRAFGLQPHRAESFKLSPDPLPIEKVRDIVGLYMNPPDHALVFCVDAKLVAGEGIRRKLEQHDGLRSGCFRFHRGAHLDPRPAQWTGHSLMSSYSNPRNTPDTDSQSLVRTRPQ